MRSAAERGSGAAGAHAGAMVGPLLQNLVLSVGDNEELCYCLKAWQALPRDLRRGGYPSKEDALKVCFATGSPFMALSFGVQLSVLSCIQSCASSRDLDLPLSSLDAAACGNMCAALGSTQCSNIGHSSSQISGSRPISCG